MKLETSEDVQEALKLCDSSSSDHTEANKNLAFQCIEKAKWLKDEKLEFEARDAYISQCFFLNHDEEAIPMFSKQLQYCDSEKGDFLNLLSTLWAYKWVINSLYEFSGIPMAQVENIFADFEQRMIKSDWAGNVIDDFRMRLAYGLGKPDEALELYRKFTANNSHELLDDCKACQLNNSVGLLIYHGLYSEAKEWVQPILDGKETCKTVPKTTYPKMVYMYTMQQEWELAEKNDLLVREHLDEENFRNDSYRWVLPYWGLSKKFVRGVDVINYQLTLMTERVSALTKFRFYEACRLFFRAMTKQGKDWVHFSTDISHMEDQPTLEGNGQGQYSTASLEVWFEQMAQKRAVKLDSRNGNNHYGEIIPSSRAQYDKLLTAYLKE